MSDKEIVRIGDNGPEEVAFKLLLEVAKAEDKAMVGTGGSRTGKPDRAWVLDTYAECLAAAKGKRLPPPPKANPSR